MKLIVHDLTEEQIKKLFAYTDDVTFMTDDGTIHNCLGCFGCWIKDPGECVIKDKYCNMGELISKCDELIIISKCCYGWVSPFVKNVIDRGISYVEPYFVMRNKEMHHKPRYANKFTIKPYLYGEDITEEEQELAKRITVAYSLNMNCSYKKPVFCKDLDELEAVL